MNNPGPKYKFSMLSVVIIFVLVYLAELGLGAGIFFNFALPKIQSYYASKATAGVSRNIISEQTSVYSLIKDNKLDEASKSAQLMLSHAKNNAEKGLSLQVVGEVQSAVSGNFETGKSNFVEALKLNPNLPGALIGLAGAQLLEKDYSHAISNSQKALTLAPQRTDYYFTLGLAYLGKGDKDKAIADIQKAVNGNPDVPLYKQTLDNIKNGTYQQQVTPTQTTTNSAPGAQNQQPAGPGYSRQDIDNLVNALNQADKDTETLKTYQTGPFPNYNPSVVNDALQTIAQRKVLAQQLLDKMGKGLPLTASDTAVLNQYAALTTKEDQLIKTLENGNGGY